MRAVGKVRYSIVAILVVGFLTFSTYVVVRISTAFRNGHTLPEMDWNDNGYTSLFEIIYGSDVIRVDTKVGSKECVEFRRMKDTSTIKTVCPD